MGHKPFHELRRSFHFARKTVPLSCSRAEDILKGNVELLSESVIAGMLSMLDRVRDLNAKITEIDKTLTELVSADPRGALLLDVLGVGTQIAARFLTTIGDIERFDSPREALQNPHL